jgi:hypothetical protein
VSDLAETSPLTYATGPAVAHLSQRGWQILFWVGAAHLLILLGVLGASWLSGGLVGTYQFARELPRDHPFPLAFLINLGIGPVMILVNLLAVRGYWAGTRRKSPRRWFLIYTPVQLALVLLHCGLLIYLAAASPYTYTPSRASVPPALATAPNVLLATATLAIEVTGLYLLPPFHAVLALPLALLLIPRIRRACFS